MADDPVITLVVSPDPLARAGLASLLDAQPGIEVADTAIPAELSPADDEAEVWVWDLGLGPAASRLDSEWPQVEIPLIVLAPDDESGGAALREGVAGVLPRDVEGPTLALAVRAAAAGLIVTDPRYLDASGEPSGPDVESPLTPREVEVLELIADGLSNRDIGTALGISAHTAKFHVKAILDKLDAASRTDAVVQAVRLGWLRL